MRFFTFPGLLLCIISLIAFSGCVALEETGIALPDLNKALPGLDSNELPKMPFPPPEKDLNKPGEDLNEFIPDENKEAVERKPQIDLRINKQIFYPFEGDYFIVPGRFRYRDRRFIVQFDRVVKKGFNLYEARFNLYDLNWNLIDYTVILEQQEVEFHDRDGSLVQLDAFIYFAYVMLPPG